VPWRRWHREARWRASYHLRGREGAEPDARLRLRLPHLADPAGAPSLGAHACGRRRPGDVGVEEAAPEGASSSSRCRLKEQRGGEGKFGVIWGS